ncbi:MULTISPECIES: Crp/Fnr family transcriptional regulator [Citrobacter]|uniref:Crp/Fnr family transcriptional regulator n=1 Tax=Citrobacter TaxID=544 RepID=UPI001F39E463|nr:MULTISPECIES: Crp/Fnr family transcriptional regulator [Citrobacter]
MKPEKRERRISIMPLGNPFPPRHCSLCPKGTAIDRNNERGLIDKRRRFAPGDIIASQGKPAASLFVIHEGYCTAQVEMNNKAVVSRFFLPGDIMALDAINDGRYISTLKAATAAEICHINLSRLLETAANDPTVAASVIKFLSHDSGFMVEKLQRYANKHADAKLAAFLVEFYEMHLRIGRPETTLRLPYSREDIASYLELKIETVSRSLKALEHLGLISLHRVRTVTLHSYLGLKSLL